MIVLKTASTRSAFRWRSKSGRLRWALEDKTGSKNGKKISGFR